MDAVPEEIDLPEVKKYLSSLEDVCDVHDLHIWAMSTTENALSAHLTVKKNTLDNKKLAMISSHLKKNFKIHHPTIQIELYDEHFECHLKPEDDI
jgi:cobalt-zinc-cadmium efflux system protein